MTYAQTTRCLDILALAQNRLGYATHKKDYILKWLCQDISYKARAILEEEMRNPKQAWIKDKML